MALDQRRGRLVSLDLVRGVVMVLMALDHVRVYAGVPAGGPSPGVFFTRWVTHFCAPAFVFFAGAGAFLYRRKLVEAGASESAANAALARFLVSRGLLLVLLELTVIRLAWSFQFDFTRFVLAGVIWMLGWCMVLLAALIWLPTSAIGAIGLLLIVFQHLFALLPRILPPAAAQSMPWMVEFLYPVGLDTPQNIAVLYTIVPWIGVMAAGYAFGAVLTQPPAERRRRCLQIGLAATALFVVAAAVPLIWQPAPAGAPPALIRFLNQNKYPASPLFLLMTLGPTIALLPLAERARGSLAEALVTFGRVPFFYYLLHIPLIHAAAIVVTLLREGSLHPERYLQAPFAAVPPEHRWSLALLYLVFAIVVVILYFPCRWFAQVKARRTEGWIRYL